MIRWAVRIVLGLVVVAVLCAGTYWAVNAIDEDLTPEARALLQPPPLAAPGADNAWQAGHTFRDLPESKPLEGWLRWHTLSESPLSQAGTMQPTLQWLLITRAPLYSQYRRVRSLPRYGETETAWPSGPMAGLPLDTALIDGAGIARAEIALAALDGRLEDAVAELEREAAYHRRAFAGSRMLLGKLIGGVAIMRDATMVSDLVEMHGEKLRPYRARLTKVVAPLPREELDLSAVFELDARLSAQGLLQYRAVILNDNKAFNEWRSPESRVQRWQAFGYRSQATVNEYARRHEANRQTVKDAYGQAWAGRGFPERPDATTSQRWRLVNPTGMLLLDEQSRPGFDYAQRMKDFSALVALVRLQVALTLDEGKREAFLRDARRDREVVLDEPFKSRATFDPASSSIRYKPFEKQGAIGELTKRFGGEFAVPTGPRREAK